MIAYNSRIGSKAAMFNRKTVFREEFDSHRFATDSIFAAQMKYLLVKGLISKEARGVYLITEKGKQYLKIMT